MPLVISLGLHGSSNRAACEDLWSHPRVWHVECAFKIVCEISRVCPNRVPLKWFQGCDDVFNVCNLISDPSVVLCNNRTSGVSRFTAWAGDQKHRSSVTPCYRNSIETHSCVSMKLSECLNKYTVCLNGL